VLAIPTRIQRPAAPVAVPTPVGLFGRVGRPDGAAVPAAVLSVIAEDGRQIAWTRADSDGGYHLDLADPGRYLVVAADAGRDPQAIEIRLDGRPVELPITLPQRPAASNLPRAAVFALDGAGQ
jgi:hypothetical protein